MLTNVFLILFFGGGANGGRFFFLLNLVTLFVILVSFASIGLDLGPCGLGFGLACLVLTSLVTKVTTLSRRLNFDYFNSFKVFFYYYLTASSPLNSPKTLINFILKFLYASKES